MSMGMRVNFQTLEGGGTRLIWAEGPGTGTAAAIDKTPGPISLGAVIGTEKHGLQQITAISKDGFQLTLAPYTSPTMPPLGGMPPAAGFDPSALRQQPPVTCPPTPSLVTSTPSQLTPQSMLMGPPPAFEPPPVPPRTGGEFYVLLFNNIPDGRHNGIHWAKSDSAGNLTFLQADEEPRLNNTAYFQQLRQRLQASHRQQSAIVCYMEAGQAWVHELVFGITGNKLQYGDELVAPPNNIQPQDSYTLPATVPPPRRARQPGAEQPQPTIADKVVQTISKPLLWLGRKLAHTDTFPVLCLTASWLIGLPGAIAGAVLGSIVGFFVGIVDAIKNGDPWLLLKGLGAFAMAGATWGGFLSGTGTLAFVITGLAQRR